MNKLVKNIQKEELVVHGIHPFFNQKLYLEKVNLMIS